MSEDQTLEKRAHRALRGEEPWGPIMDRIHAFVRGDLDAQIAALTERLRAVEAERDACATGEQCMADEANAKDRENVSLRAQLSALRAELERKDAALKELCKDEPLVEPEWIESDNHGDIRSNASDITRWHLAKIARAALQPKEPPCKA